MLSLVAELQAKGIAGGRVPWRGMHGVVRELQQFLSFLNLISR